MAKRFTSTRWGPRPQRDFCPAHQERPDRIDIGDTTGLAWTILRTADYFFRAGRRAVFFLVEVRFLVDFLAVVFFLAVVDRFLVAVFFLVDFLAVVRDVDRFVVFFLGDRVAVFRVVFFFAFFVAISMAPVRAFSFNVAEPQGALLRRRSPGQRC